MEAAELSRSIEDAAFEVQQLPNKSPLRSRMQQLTEDLVVELQDLSWRHNHPRRSLVSSEDLSEDAQAARDEWRCELADVPPSVEHRLVWLGSRGSILGAPAGLEVAAQEHRRSIGQFRSTVRAYGFMAPDTLRRQDLDALAFAEMARHRFVAWGEVAAEALQTANLDVELTLLFQGALVAEAVAERFAHALRLFVAGDADAAAHIVIPRIEATIRQVAIARKIPALEVAYRSLGNISFLDRLLRRISDGAPLSDRPVWNQFRLLLTDDQCVGIRNVSSHGLRRDIGMIESTSIEEAALLLHVAAFLSTLDKAGNCKEMSH